MKNQRVLYMLPLLAIAAYLALFADKTPEDELVAPVRRVPPAAVAAAVPSPADAGQAAQPDASGVLPLIPRAPLAEQAAAGGIDLFAHGVEIPVGPEQQAREEAEHAVAPPPDFPYAFIGKQFDGQSWQAFFEKGEVTLVVSVGAVIDNDFRVQSIKPPQMLVLHVPSKQILNIDIDNAQ